MGLRFYRRIPIAPGIRLNVGTRASSVSFGHKGLWYTVGAHGRRTATLGWPGTGLRYTKTMTTAGTRTPLPSPKPAPSALSTLLWVLVALAVLTAITHVR